MPAISASAPGKIILFGEHAVVYDRPAIAVPVSQVKARAVVMANPHGKSGDVLIDAPDIHLKAHLGSLPKDHPLGLAVQCVIDTFKISKIPSLILRITSTIPIASGLGSGAAVSVAIIRVLSNFLGHPLPDERVSELAYSVEKHYHGSPSGIDNTVVTFARPIFFRRSQPFEILKVAKAMTFIIGDSGVPSPTALAVSGVRQRWQKNPYEYENSFDSIGKIVLEGRKSIEDGDIDQVGSLMITNHEFLKIIGVSTPDLNRLVETAIKSGAIGAKLSGGGCGGNMIALAQPDITQNIADALLAAGAVNTIITQVNPE